MANNKSIQLLRGNGLSSNQVLLTGQPYYDMENNNLYIGNTNNAAINAVDSIHSISFNIQAYWENVKNKTVAVRAGDRAFIELKEAGIHPVLCVDADYTGSTWQTSFWAHSSSMLISSTTDWAKTVVYDVLHNTILRLLFPNYLKDMITPISKSSDTATASSSSTLWVPSVEEIWGNVSVSGMVKTNSTRFEYYRQLLTSMGRTTPTTATPELSSNHIRWLRNRSSSSASSWCALATNGATSIDSANSQNSIIYCFTIN